MFQQDIDLSVQMERVLKDILDGYIADPTARVKGFEGFLKALDSYAVQHKTKFSYLERTVTALHNRLKKFMRGVLKEIFDVNHSNVSFDELLQKKVIIDMGYLQSQRVPKDDIRFLMNFLVRLYGVHAIKRGLQHQLRNLIIVEECQFLVPELYKKQTSIDATPTEDLSILLRAYGVGFIFVGTRPLFAENSLANSYNIISFQLTKDAELLQKYMNLDERQVNYLKRMNSQECLIFSPTLKYPTRVRVNAFKGRDITKEIIRTRNFSNYPTIYENIVSDMPQNHFKKLIDVTKTVPCEECALKETTGKIPK
jgi:sulfur relay (sulfurtransferase) DsrF/TusC family protein